MAINAYDKRSFAQYTPLTMQEVLMPAQLQRERHDALDAQYAAINDEAAKLKFLVDNESDNSGFKQGFYDYQNKLKGATEDLLANGVNYGSLRKMLNMKNSYTELSTPIMKAYEVKSIDDKIAAEFQAKGIVHENTKRDLWDYAMNNYTPMGVQYVDQNAVADDLYKLASSLQRWQSAPEYKEQFLMSLKSMGYDDDGSIGMMLESNSIAGLTPEELDSSSIMKRLKYEVLKKHNAINEDGSYKAWMNDTDMGILNSAVYAGSWGAVGGNKIDTIANPYFNMIYGSSPNALATAKGRRNGGSGSGDEDDLPKALPTTDTARKINIGLDASSSEEIAYKDGKVMRKNYIYSETDYNAINNLLNVMEVRNLNDDEIKQLGKLSAKYGIKAIYPVINEYEVNDANIMTNIQLKKKVRDELTQLKENTIYNDGVIQNVNASAALLDTTNEKYLDKITEMKNSPGANIEYFAQSVTSKEEKSRIIDMIRDSHHADDVLYEVDEKRGGVLNKTAKIKDIFDSDYEPEDMRVFSTHNGIIVETPKGQFLWDDKLSQGTRFISKAIIAPEIMNSENILKDVKINKGTDNVTIDYNGNSVSLTPSEYRHLTESGNSGVIDMVARRIITQLGIDVYNHTNLGRLSNERGDSINVHPFEIVIPTEHGNYVKLTGAATRTGIEVGAISTHIPNSATLFKSAADTMSKTLRASATGLSASARTTNK